MKAVFDQSLPLQNNTQDLLSSSPNELDSFLRNLDERREGEREGRSEGRKEEEKEKHRALITPKHLQRQAPLTERLTGETITANVRPKPFTESRQFP